MAKLKAPLLSFFATGNLAKILAFRGRGSTTVAERYPFPKDARSSPQLTWRTIFQMAVDWWHQLSSAEQAEWEALARPRHMTGYALFLSTALKPNPGIYLPLIGGAMKGDIDMANHYIFNQKLHAAGAYLPAPDQIIPNVTNTTIQLSATVFDYQSDFDTVNYRFLAPFPGLALAVAQVTYQNPSDGSRLLTYIRTNIAVVANGSQVPGAVQATGPPALALVPLNQGDYIYVQTYHSCGQDEAVRNGSSWTYLYVAMLAKFS